MINAMIKCDKCRKDFLLITATNARQLVANMEILIKTNKNLDVCPECQAKEEKEDK